MSQGRAVVGSAELGGQQGSLTVVPWPAARSKGVKQVACVPWRMVVGHPWRHGVQHTMAVEIADAWWGVDRVARARACGWAGAWHRASSWDGVG